MREFIRIFATILIGFGAFLAADAGPLRTQFVLNPKAKKTDDPKAVVVLFDDNVDEMITRLVNRDGGSIPSAEYIDAYSGTAAIRVTPSQSHNQQIEGWSYPLRLKPKDGEFRYLRFSWKKIGGDSTMLQLSDHGNWEHRYYSGKNIPGWPPTSKQLSPDLPTSWTLVTVDLVKDWGEFTLTGIAFTPQDGTAGLYDHVLLGKTIEDLDKATESALGQTKPTEVLTGEFRRTQWKNLLGYDRDKAATSLKLFLSDAKNQTSFVRERLKEESGMNPPPSSERLKVIGNLIAELDVDNHDRRERAYQKLLGMGEEVVEPLRLAEKKGSPEMMNSASRILKELRADRIDVDVEDIRAGRIVRILERAGTEDSKKLLREMAVGDYGPRYIFIAKR